MIFIGGRANTKIAAEIYRENHIGSISYYADRDYDRPEFAEHGFSFIEDFEIVCEKIIEGSDYFVGIGGNKLRNEVSEKLIAKTKKKPINIVSNRAYIAPKVALGNGNLVMHDVLINLNSRIGSGNIFNSKSLLEHDCLVGNYNHIAPAVTILGYATVGNLCDVFTSTVIFPYKKISDSVTIGANSTVTRDISEPGIYIGSPAKLIIS